MNGRRPHPPPSELSGLGHGRVTAAAVVLIAVPTAAAAIAFMWLADPRVAPNWPTAVGAVDVLLAVVCAPLILHLQARHLRRATSRYLQGFEDAAIGMAPLSRDLRVLRVNPAFCELLGRPPRAVLGRSILAFTHPEDVDLSRAKADATVGGDEAPLVKRYVRGDGSTVEAVVTIAFVEPSGSEPYFFSQLQDVTEQRRASGRSLRSQTSGGGRSTSTARR